MSVSHHDPASPSSNNSHNTSATQCGLYAALFAACPAFMFLSDPTTGRFVEVNDAYCRLVGYEREDLLGKSPVELGIIPQELHEELLAALERGERYKNAEAMVRHRSGQGLRVLFSLEMLDYDGKSLALASGMDVSERARLRDELAEREATLRAIFDNAPEGVVVCDAKGRVTMANPMARALHREPGTQPLGPVREKTPRTLGFDGRPIDPLDMPLFRSALEGETCRQMEYRLEWPDDGHRWIMANSAPITDAEGRRLGALALLQDVTEQKELERHLRESEQRFKAAVDNIPEVFAIYGPDLRFTFVNKAAQVATGLRREDILGRRDGDLFPSEVTEAFLPRLRQCLETRQPQRFEASFTLQGQTISMDIAYVPLLDPAGEVRQILGVCHDLTERKRNEARLLEQYAVITEQNRQLLEAEVVLQAIGDIPGVLYYVKDIQGRLTRVSETVLRLMGLDEAEALGRTSAELLGPEVGGPHMESDREVLAAGRPLVFLETLELPGRTRQYLSVKSPFLGEGGDLAGLVGVSMDVTRLKETEERLQNARDEADRANRTKSLFLANMSHEIRTPLNGVMGLIDLCRADPTSPDNAEYLGLARQAASNLLDIINDILDLSKIEAGKLALQEKPFGARVALEQALLGLRTLAEDKGLELVHHLEAGVPEVLLGDEVRLRQVLTNLVGNAIKFTERGRVSVNVEEAGAAGDGRLRLRFTVRDTGPGIPPDRLESIFETFAQVENATQSRHGGTGLGLAICRRLTAMMDGDLRVESELGRGSAFTFTALFGLPESAPQAQTATAPEPLQAAQAPNLKGLRVLVAEDNPINRFYFCELLKRLECRADGAEDGENALRLLETGTYDAVLMDVQMPGLDGLEVTGRIRSGRCAGAAVDIPVIALTAYALQGDRERFLAAGMDDYVAKPVDEGALIACLERAARKRTADHGKTTVQAQRPTA